jgi:hypothetical protein
MGSAAIAGAGTMMNDSPKKNMSNPTALKILFFLIFFLLS